MERLNSEVHTPQPTLEAGSVTRLAVQKKNKDRVSVFVNGKFAFGLHQDLVLQHQIVKGLTLDVARQQALIEADRFRQVYDKMLHFIGYRARTEYEVRQKMRQLDCDAALIDRIVERLYTYAYLDDEAYARTYVRSRRANKGFGPRRIQAELRRRGVDPQLIETVLEELIDEDETLRLAREQAEKRWARLNREADPHKRRKKVFDYLIRRGFDLDLTREIVRELE